MSPNRGALRYLVPLIGVEGALLAGALVRYVLSAKEPSFALGASLWLFATMGCGFVALAQYIVRASVLARQFEEEVPVDRLKAVLGASLALLGLGAALLAVGPLTFSRLTGLTGH